MKENDPRKIEDHKLPSIFLGSHNASPKPLLRANEKTILFERGPIYCFTTSPENCSELHFFRLAEKSRQQIAWHPIKRKSSGAGGVINPTNRSSGQNWKLFLHNVRCGGKKEISKLPAHVGASNSKLDQTLDLSISTSNTLSSLSCLL